MESKKTKVLLVPDWLSWITGTEAKAIKAYNPQLDCDIVPSAALRHAIACGWKPEREFDLAHLLTTEVAQEFGSRFLGVVPTVTSLHHIHDEQEVAIDTAGDAIMTVSSQWEKELVQRGIAREKFVRLANGVDCERFHPPSPAEKDRARARSGLRAGEVAVGFAGKKGSDNFGRKGFDIYCEGLCRLHALGIPCVAVVLGSGWQNELERLLPPEIRRIHQAYVHDPALFYRALDFYWVCSRIEGGPVPLLEAMASGVPCVCRDVGMVRDAIVKPDEGVVLEQGQPEDFARETAALGKDPARYAALSAGGRRAMVSRFRWAETARSAPELYDRAIRGFAGRMGTGQPPATLHPAAAPKDSDLSAVLIMESVPAHLRRKGLCLDDLQMPRELFRVRNMWRASALCLRLLLRYPDQAGAILSVMATAWFGRLTMAIGRWRRRFRIAVS
jgi:glycosyltransferase involved in cell wall biosynthesis